MANDNNHKRPPAKLDRELMEQLMFGTGKVRRFTQDSPVLPDVWLEYAKEGDDATRLASRGDEKEPFPLVKLLLTPYRQAATGELRSILRKRLEAERKSKAWRAFGHDAEPLPRVVYNQSTVAAILYFEDLIRVVLPMTEWWERISKKWNPAEMQRAVAQRRLAEALKDPEHPPIDGKTKRRLPPDVLWMIRVVGALAVVHKKRKLPAVFTQSRLGIAQATTDDWLELVRAVAELIKGVTAPKLPAGDKVRSQFYSVSLNREATPTISRSTLAVKADAARRLFDISCRDLTWAIIDTGIDAKHPAFRARNPKGDPPAGKKAVGDGDFSERTRVVATYDFTQIDLLLDPDTKEQPENVQKRLKGRGADTQKLQEQIDHLNSALMSGRSIDWGLVAPLLRITHDKKYVAPGNDHGTHVAGILAADWKRDESEGVLEEDLVGVCPDLRLYDLRVLDKDGRGDEFTVMAALQFVRYLNSTHDYVAVHGVNLSLSIPHDISNYACGRTPVCDESERVVSSGIVVVAAAGNQGYRRYTTAEGMTTEAYNSISITDPGNADLVITVGATHRFRPHTYGVSYFSSRGPTGDGRIKPDLVAPGEKITSPLPEGSFGLKDGTSMAAPHVSGAAALLMARHNELVGRPARIKQILCSTATDLGRERYFQGAGMLDVLRALQSV